MYDYRVLLVGENCIAPLKSLPCKTLSVNSGQAALEQLTSFQADIIVYDLGLSDLSAQDFLEQICSRPHAPAIILTTATPDITEAVQLIKAGALEYLSRPLDTASLQKLNDQLLARSAGRDNVITQAPESQHLYQVAEQVARSEATALITGESGTGKEVLAGFIHRHSSRRAQTMVAINCAAIPENLLESELFGYAKGAFTGAHTARPGKFEQANQSTLFLDEIGELPLHLQAKLLRVLQEREVERIGSQRSVKLDIRIIAATNQNLEELVKQGKFREDLYYRLNVFPLRCLPLRERCGDILPLADYFLQASGSQKSLSSDAQQSLRDYSWPGNVRELENTIQRALVISQQPQIQGQDLMLPQSLSRQAFTPETDISESLEEHCRKAEYRHIISVLNQQQGKREQTARVLGITTRTLRNKLSEMRRSGINPSEQSSEQPLTSSVLNSL
ncbi:sigma-54-dependent transcriptional regulator [Parendozoicomonas haliclonae]|uniref:Nitrogen assimilation regulatory protein n=1 Tax=Parendozoicomonas haliclonae TaxID=1960125 RepID=A0A1X7AGX1_9GAMM|nr:sigma-54 dependent transcriptional regulator [Parendozoicomonas haliclonae]SMA39678.1 Nitrogen assimilation regulatory protein [Parendozoicomonas haliclonae]